MTSVRNFPDSTPTKYRQPGLPYMPLRNALKDLQISLDQAISAYEAFLAKVDPSHPSAVLMKQQLERNATAIKAIMSQGADVSVRATALREMISQLLAMWSQAEASGNGAKPEKKAGNVAPLLWFDAANYSYFRNLFEDCEVLPRTYHDWWMWADAEEKNLVRRGRHVVRVQAHPDEFLRWCDANGHKRMGATARKAFCDAKSGMLNA